MIIRKAERAEIDGIIAAEYADETAYIRAFANAIEGFLRNRKSSLVVLSVGGIQVPYGPFWSLTGAKTAIGPYLSVDVGLTAKLVEVKPPSALKLDDWVPPPSRCPECDHPRGAHEGSMGCIIGIKSMKRAKRPDVSEICGCRAC
jgi:hypothetical protein